VALIVVEAGRAWYRAVGGTAGAPELPLGEASVEAP